MLIWVPKFATGIYIIRRNAFIFNFLTRLDYKHKNWLISNFLNAFYLFWSAMWTPSYKSQWLVCWIWVQNVTNRTLNFEIFFAFSIELTSRGFIICIIWSLKTTMAGSGTARTWPILEIHDELKKSTAPFSWVFSYKISKNRKQKF